MNIKKRSKKEKGLLRRSGLIILVLILIIPYMIFVLNEEGIFDSSEYLFALIYASVIDLLLFFYFLKRMNDQCLEFLIKGRKLRISSGWFSFAYAISLDKIVYVDVLEGTKQSFEIVVLMKKGKVNKKLEEFNAGFVKTRQQYKPVYEHLSRNNTIVDFQCTRIQKGGVRKFKLLYVLFKNAVQGEFSSRAVDYVKKYMEEYNVS